MDEKQKRQTAIDAVKVLRREFEKNASVDVNVGRTTIYPGRWWVKGSDDPSTTELMGEWHSELDYRCNETIGDFTVDSPEFLEWLDCRVDEALGEMGLTPGVDCVVSILEPNTVSVVEFLPSFVRLNGRLEEMGLGRIDPEAWTDRPVVRKNGRATSTGAVRYRAAYARDEIDELTDLLADDREVEKVSLVDGGEIDWSGDAEGFDSEEDGTSGVRVRVDFADGGFRVI